MTQMVLAAMLAGYLALTPATEVPRPEQKKDPPGSRGIRLRSSPVVSAPPRRVLILDHPFEPSYAYIRVDNAVYPLRVS